jgi:hypothetical protein
MSEVQYVITRGRQLAGASVGGVAGSSANLSTWTDCFYDNQMCPLD